MFPIFILWALVAVVPAADILNITDISKIYVPDGMNNTQVTTVSFASGYELADLEFYIDHGDGQSDWEVELSGAYSYDHTYSRRGVYTGRLTVLTKDGDDQFQSVQYTVQVGNIQMVKCYPPLLVEDDSYDYEYQYTDDKNKLISESESFKPSLPEVDEEITETDDVQEETIVNPCDSIVRVSKTQMFSVNLVKYIQGNIAVPAKTVTFNLHAGTNITGLTHCIVDFGDLTHSTNISISNSLLINDHMGFCTHQYIKIGIYSARVYCWNEDEFIRSDTLDIHVVSALSQVRLSIVNSVIDLVNPEPDVNLTLTTSLNEAPDIYDTIVNTDLKEGTTNETRIFLLTNGEYFLPALTHNYNLPGRFWVEAKLSRADNDELHTATSLLIVSESIHLVMELKEVEGIVMSEKTLEIIITNATRFDISYTVDFNSNSTAPVTYVSTDFSAPFQGFPTMQFEYPFGGEYNVTLTAHNGYFRQEQILTLHVLQGTPKSGWELVKSNNDKVIIDESTVGFKLEYTVNPAIFPTVLLQCEFDYGDGFTEEAVEVSFPNTRWLPWQHSFVQLGALTVIMSCENNISSHALTLDLEVRSYTQADYRLIYNQAIGISGTLETPNTRMTKFRFSLLGIKEVFPHLITWVFGDGSPRMSRILHTYKESHLYPIRGIYDGQVIVWSPKGNFTYDFQIFIGITNLTIYPSAGRKNESMKIQLAEKRGSTFSSVIRFGDGTTESDTCHKSCSYSHIFDNPGFYNVTTKITEGDIVEELVFPDAIFIDNPVTGLFIKTRNAKITQPPGIVVVDIQLYPGERHINYMMCFIDLGDKLDRRIRRVEGGLTNETKLTLEGRYTSLGPQRISANCTNRVGEETITTDAYVTSTCFGGDGIFEKLYADPNTPLLIMASTTVEITSRAVMLCVSHPINFTWSAWSLVEWSFERNFEVEIEQPNRDSFTIQRGSLEPKLYSLELNVSTIHGSESHWLYGLTYIRIIGSPLVVEFRGGIIRATGNEKAIVDVASLSHDPDKESKSEYNMTFTWSCRYFMTKSASQLSLTVERYDPGYHTPCDNFSKEIAPGIRRFDNLPDYEIGYKYSVSATSGSKSSKVNAEAYVQYTKGAPDVAIECIVNCEVKRARSSPIVVEVKCPYCFKDEFYLANLTWTLYSWDRGMSFTPVSNLHKIIDFIEDNPAALIIQKSKLTACMKYRLKVIVDMSTRQKLGESFSDFTVNCPPSLGTCVTEPTKGEARETNFQTTCSDWMDDGYGPTDVLEATPFIYKFYISQGIYLMPLFQGAQALTPDEPLPVIPGTKGGKYTIVCRIFDALNDYAEFNTTITLKVPVLRSLKQIGKANMAEFTSGVAKDTSVLSKQLVTTTYSSSILQTVEVNSMTTFLEEFSGSENSAANQDVTWQNVFDKFLKNRKDKDMKLEISRKYKSFVDMIDDKWRNVTSMDGHGIEALGEALTTVMHQQDTVDYEISDKGNELINSGASILNSLSQQDPFPIQEKVDDVVFAMTGALDTIYNKHSPTYRSSENPIELNVGGMSEDEKQMMSLMVLKEQAELDQEKINRGPGMIDSVENTTATLLNVMLKDQTMGQRSKNIKREGISLTARKLTARTLKTSGFEADSFSMKFPGSHNESMNVTDMISLKASVSQKNIYSFSADGSSYDITSPVLSLRMDNVNGTSFFDGAVTLKIKRPMPEFNLYKTNDTCLGQERFCHHQFQVKKKSESSFVFIDIGRHGTDVGAYIRYNQAPVSYAPDVTYVKGEYVTYNSASRKKRGVSSIIKFTFKPGELQIGLVYFAIDFGEMAKYIKEYFFLAYADGCRVWDRERNVWSNESCKISPYSTPEETLCDCVNAPGHNFASSFYVPPNMINFDLVFGKFDAENAAVYGTLIGLFVVFGIAAIWAKRKGRIDEKMWGVGYLRDNFVEDHYFYLLTVHTGLTGSSGTTSRVSFILTGQDGDAGVRLLSDGERNLETGTVMTFVMATTQCLGNLVFLRIWHDNSGDGATQNWYLSKFVVEDIQTNTRSVFVCDEWLALDKSDGLIDRVLPVSFEDDLMSFSKLFSEHNRVNISDTHLWLSVLLRPEKSLFTRVQRVLTCLATLLLAMISSAMFYKAEDAEGNSSNNPGSEVQLGTMRFSITTLYTSAIGLVVTVPPIMLLVFLFKSRRPWKKKLGCCGCRRKQELDPSESSTELELSQANSECNLHDVIEKDPLSSNYDKNPLPPCCLIVAWVLLIVIILVCSFCLILYSMQWGKTVSEEWLASFVLSFFESIFIMDPLKVIMLSTLFALCMRNPQGNPKSEKLSIDVVKEQSSFHGCTEIDPTILPPDPMPKDMLERAREKKRQESLANQVFIELLLYILFVFCIFCVSYGNRDARSYNLNNHISNQLVNSPFRKHAKMYYGSDEEAFTWSKLRTVDDIYLWLNTSMQATMLPWYSFNGEVLSWQKRLFIKDQANYRVGPVRIRQARMPRGRPHMVKEEPSFTGPYITNQENLLGSQERSPAYSINDEEVGDYCWQWNPLPCSKEEEMQALTPSAWRHRTTREEKAFPVIGKFALYSGAGYVFDMRFNKHVITQIILNELRLNSWLDIQTRAVFVEFTLYNADANLLTSVRLAAEIPEYGGVFTWSDVKPMRIYDHSGGLGALILICQIISVLANIYFMVKVCKKLREMKCAFFGEIWNVLDVLIVTLCLVALIMYIIRKVLITKAMGSFKRDPKVFVNFYEAALCDDIYGWVLAAVVFLCTLRIMRILGYNKRILMIAAVLQRAGPGLFSFSVLFGVIISAFMSTGYALFHANLESFMTLWESYITIIYLLMGKNVFKKMVVVSAILSRIYFFILAVLVVFVFLTIFQAILNFTISEVHSDVANEPVPYGVMNVLYKFYSTLVLDNRIVETLKRWGGPKSDGKTKDPKDIPPPPQAAMETDSSQMQKIFSVLRDHLNTTMEDTKQFHRELSRSNYNLKESQNPSRAVSPRQVDINTAAPKRKKKINKTSKQKSGNSLSPKQAEDMFFPSQPEGNGHNTEWGNLQTGNTRSAILKPGKALPPISKPGRAVPTISKPRKLLSGISKPRNDSQPGSGQSDAAQPGNNRPEPRLPPPPRSVWAAGIKSKK